MAGKGDGARWGVAISSHLRPKDARLATVATVSPLLGPGGDATLPRGCGDGAGVGPPWRLSCPTSLMPGLL